MQTKAQTKFKPSNIIIFEEADGWHWDSKTEVEKHGYLDARGKGYPSKRAAMRAARRHYEQPDI